MSDSPKEYYETIYRDAAPIHHHAYIIDGVVGMLKELGVSPGTHARILDLGCGNGSLTANIAALGYQITGIDSSKQGIETASHHFPAARFIHGDITNPPAELADERFDVVMAIEVIEHLIAPRILAAAARRALKPGGHFLLTTPYHGYAKNLAVALMGRCDRHYNPLWDGGHVKFFSPATLQKLLEQEGMTDIRFRYAGRFPYFWKSMVCSCRPADSGK